MYAPITHFVDNVQCGAAGYVVVALRGGGVALRVFRGRLQLEGTHQVSSIGSCSPRRNAAEDILEILASHAAGMVLLPLEAAGIALLATPARHIGGYLGHTRYLHIIGHFGDGAEAAR